MTPEIAVLDIQGEFRIYTEFYRAEGAEKTIVLVNGSLATTASFAQTVRSLHPQLNVVLYDQPYSGKSKPHNLHEKPLTREMEGQILLELIDHFRAEHVMSFSWGGAAALVALSHRPRLIEKAVISSFSPIINEHMRDYLHRNLTHLGNHDRYQIGQLINATIGQHLPSLFKRFNFRHVSSLDLHEYDQMHYHISHVLELDPDNYLAAARLINVPVLFMNGAWDKYTAANDAVMFGNYVQHSHFSCIEAAGHFLDMEHKTAARDTQQAVLGFLKPATAVVETQHYHHAPAQEHYAYAF